MYKFVKTFGYIWFETHVTNIQEMCDKHNLEVSSLTHTHTHSCMKCNNRLKIVFCSYLNC